MPAPDAAPGPPFGQPLREWHRRRHPSGRTTRCPDRPSRTLTSTTAASAATRDVVHAFLGRLAPWDLDGLAALFAPAVEWQLS